MTNEQRMATMVAGVADLRAAGYEVTAVTTNKTIGGACWPMWIHVTVNENRTLWQMRGDSAAWADPRTASNPHLTEEEAAALEAVVA